METHDDDTIRQAVRERYGAIARGEPRGCCGGAGGCGPDPDASRALGYSDSELAAVPEGTNLGLGCGNPQAIAALRPGEHVLDLGAGGGFDCLLAARQVGPSGQVIGVDMTADMVGRARDNAARLGVDNVEFRLGEIEHLPVRDASIDVILSNCVVNLSPDKPAVYREALRVLRPGGRLAISDVVRTGPLPAALEADLAATTGCIAGAADVAGIEAGLREAGFEDIRVRVKPESRAFIEDWAPGTGIEAHVASATIEARRPASESCCAPSCCGREASS